MTSKCNDIRHDIDVELELHVRTYHALSKITFLIKLNDVVLVNSGNPQL